MDTLQAIILGIVQGLTEFLPVSSSGHLQIAKELLGVELTDNISFDVALHAATVLSTMVVMRREIGQLFGGLFARPVTEAQRYVLKIVVSMIPAAVVGVCFSDTIETLFSSLPFVGCMLLLTAALLTFAYCARPREKGDISFRDAFLIGCAQAAATMPGLSRSGSTIATGLLLGNRRESVARFSFLMVIPVILGKMLLDILSGDMTAAEVDAVPLAAGFAAAFAVGALACRFMLGIVQRGKLIWFALYCAAAGLVSLLGPALLNR